MTVIEATKSQIKYLAQTDFNLISICIEKGISPDCYPILHYLESQHLEGVEAVNLDEMSRYLGLSHDTILGYSFIFDLVGLPIPTYVLRGKQ